MDLYGEFQIQPELHSATLFQKEMLRSLYSAKIPSHVQEHHDSYILQEPAEFGTINPDLTDDETESQ